MLIGGSYCEAKKTLSESQFLDDNYYVVTVTKKEWNGDEKIVKATKNDCYFHINGFSQYRNTSKRLCHSNKYLSP